MAASTFDYFVIGDSPGGAYVLSRLPHWLGRTPSLGMLGSNHVPSPIWVTGICAKLFGLTGLASKRAELLLPTEVLGWEAKTLSQRFSQVSSEVWQSLFQTEQADWGGKSLGRVPVELLEQILKNYPELLGAAEGFWRIFGRSDSATWQVKLWNALAALELFHWDYYSEIPTETFRYRHLNWIDNVESIRRSSVGDWEVSTREDGLITAKSLILALTASQMEILAKKLSPSLNFSELGTGSLKRIQFKIVLEPGAIPAPMADLSLWFDTWQIPDPVREIWPMERQEDRVQFSLKIDPSVPAEAIIHTFKGASQRLFSLRPDLCRRIKGYFPPLHFGECVDEDVRTDRFRALSSAMEATSTLSLMEPRTRFSNLFLVGDHFFSQWPYPMGELWAASYFRKQFEVSKKPIAKWLGR